MYQADGFPEVAALLFLLHHFYLLQLLLPPDQRLGALRIEQFNRLNPYAPPLYEWMLYVLNVRKILAQDEATAREGVKLSLRSAEVFSL